MDCCFKIVAFVQKRLPRYGLSLKGNSHAVKDVVKETGNVVKAKANRKKHVTTDDLIAVSFQMHLVVPQQRELLK